jgi:hypothetical protein
MNIMIMTRFFVAIVVGFVGMANIVVGQEITEDSYFYGQSPPVYPSREFYHPVSNSS